jgi:hypothetical protein
VKVRTSGRYAVEKSTNQSESLYQAKHTSKHTAKIYFPRIYKTRLIIINWRKLWLALESERGSYRTGENTYTGPGRYGQGILGQQKMSTLDQTISSAVLDILKMNEPR